MGSAAKNLTLQNHLPVLCGRGKCQNGVLWLLARMEAMGTEAVDMASF
jgi:hypothetical protein